MVWLVYGVVVGVQEKGKRDSKDDGGENEQAGNVIDECEQCHHDSNAVKGDCHAG